MTERVDRAPQEKVYLFYPKYWLTWLNLGLLYVITRLPYKQQLKIGSILGFVGYYFFKKFRHVAERNIQLCFPTISVSGQQKLTKSHFKSLGMGIIETAMSWWLTDKKLENLYTISGAEYLEDSLSPNKGLIILSGHFTSLEICGRLLASHRPFHAVYREQKNAVIDHFLNFYRRYKTNHLIHRHNVRKILKTLKNRQAIWYAADQDYGSTHSVFAPFFSIPAATITMPSFYAQKTGARILTAACYRRPNGEGYHIIIQPFLENFPSGDDLTDATCFNKQLEKDICRAPEQYLWIHRRFKTRPPGQTDFY